MTEPHGTSHPGTGHERRDVVFRPIVAAGIGLALLIVAAAIGMNRLFEYLAAREAAESRPASPLAAGLAPRLPPDPRLQSAPIKDLEELRAAEDEILTGYGWVDREQGIVRIPIERAMDLLAGAAPGSAEAPR
jgi:hypothetical protein